MHAPFGYKREKHNRLFYMEYEDDLGSLHFHSPIELYFVDEGEMEATVTGTRRLLKAGEMSVALSFSPHSYRTPEHSRSATLIIPAYLCKDFQDSIRSKTAVFPFLLDQARVAEIRAYARQLADASINPIKRTGYIHLVLGTVLEELTLTPAKSCPDTDLASLLLFYLNENFREEFSLSSLAAHFGYSESYLSRYFKDCFHIGLKQYVNLLRLRCAMMLLADGGKSITDCAMESGFNSMRSFYRFFVQEIGCTPRQWREQTAQSQ